MCPTSYVRGAGDLPQDSVHSRRAFCRLNSMTFSSLSSGFHQARDAGVSRASCTSVLHHPEGLNGGSPYLRPSPHSTLTPGGSESKEPGHLRDGLHHLNSCNMQIRGQIGVTTGTFYIVGHSIVRNTHPQGEKGMGAFPRIMQNLRMNSF